MNEFSSSPEGEDAITNLPAELGFIDNRQLATLREVIREAGIAGDESLAKELIIRYALQAELLINQQEGSDFPRAQIGLIIAKALAWKDAGRVDRCKDELTDGLEYAESMGYDDVAAKIRETLEQN